MDRCAVVSAAGGLAVSMACAGCTCAGDEIERQSSERSQPDDDVYTLNRVRVVHLTLSDKSIRRLKKNPRSYVRADLIIGDNTYKSIGVRLKGARSFRSFQNKPSFKLHLNRWRKCAEHAGQTRFTLNNLVEDPTMLREVLGYQLYRAMGVPSPRLGYIHLYVNNQSYGLYAIIEHLGKRFLSRHFEDSSGGLYEGEYGCDLFGDDVDWFDQDSGRDDSRADLHEFARTVAGADEGIFDPEQGALDMNEFLAYLAVSASIGDFDGYRHSHNYRVYYEPTSRKWHFLPWGIDRVFKKSLSIYDSEGLLATRCFDNPRCHLAYIRMLREVADRFESLDLGASATSISAVIDKVARADRRKPASNSRMKRKRKQLLEYIERRPDEIRGQTTCIDDNGAEVDRDGDGHGCMDCDDTDPEIHPGATETCDRVDNDCSRVIDDNPACACPTQTIDGVEYHVCNVPLPWVEAKAFCEAQGLRLARIDNRKQSRGLHEHVRGIEEESWWIGLSDRGKESIFRWEDSSLPEFTYWSSGDPDNDGCNQDCGALEENCGGYWHDTHCGEHRPFICRAY